MGKHVPLGHETLPSSSKSCRRPIKPKPRALGRKTCKAQKAEWLSVRGSRNHKGYNEVRV